VRPARSNTPASARALALRMLGRRDYSRLELATRLRARGLPADEIATMLDDFERLGYLSDERYANALVAKRVGRVGMRQIERDLQVKGIGGDTAKEALSGLAGRDELADALALWQRRFGQAPIDEREKARQVRFLVSRGFSASIAFRVLRSAAAGTDDDSALA
jgi:regulatory protein